MSREEQDQILNTIIVNTIRFAMTSDKKIHPEKIFQMVWDIVFDKLYLNCIQGTDKNINNISFGTYQLNVRDYLLYKIISLFRHYKIDYSPFVSTNDNALLDEIKGTQKSVILVSVHNGFTHNLKLFEDINRGITTIGVQPYVNQALDRSGIKNKINVIKKDKYSLAYLKKVISEGDLISSTVDYSTNKGLFKHINTNLFKFAAMNNLPLYFIKSDVTETGKVNIMMKLAPNSQDPNINAGDYIKFYNSVGHSRKILVVGS